MSDKNICLRCFKGMFFRGYHGSCAEDHITELEAKQLEHIDHIHDVILDSAESLDEARQEVVNYSIWVKNALKASQRG